MVVESLKRTGHRRQAWVVFVATAVFVVVLMFYSLPNQRPVESPAGTRASQFATTPLLDRDAERSPAPTRSGGPGGQIGDAP